MFLIRKVTCSEVASGWGQVASVLDHSCHCGFYQPCVSRVSEPPRDWLWGRPVWCRGEGPVRAGRWQPGPFTDAGLSSPCSVTAVRLADGITFVVYEFWETEEEWKR